MSDQGRSVVRVWDPLLRALHWVLAASVLASWYTRHGYGWVHEWLGYFTLAVVLARLAWGFLGPEYARFGQFLVAPGQTLEYARQFFTQTAPRYLGHNPLGGCMSLALWLMVCLVCGSGWLYTTDRYWGLEWVENLHDSLTWVLIALVVVHLAGVFWSSRVHHENLVTSMLHGNKRAPGQQDRA